MKEAQREEQLLVETRSGAAVKFLLFHQLVKAFHVGFHTLRDNSCWLIGIACVRAYVRVCESTSTTFGGSVVSLMPDCRIVMGKSGCGEELSQSLKSG